MVIFVVYDYVTGEFYAAFSTREKAEAYAHDDWDTITEYILDSDEKPKLKALMQETFPFK